MISMAIWITTMVTQITMGGVGLVGIVGAGPVRGAASHNEPAGQTGVPHTSCRVPIVFEHSIMLMSSHKSGMRAKRQREVKNNWPSYFFGYRNSTEAVNFNQIERPYRICLSITKANIGMA